MIRNAPRAAWKLAIGVAALALALGGRSPAAAAEFVMKFGTATHNETQHEFLNMYKAALEKASGGRIEVQVYPGSQLGPIPREIEGVQLGSIQAYIGPVDFYVGRRAALRHLQRADAVPATTPHMRRHHPRSGAGARYILELAKAKRMVGVAHVRHRHRRTTPPSARCCGFRISTARSSASTAPRWSARR